MKKIFAIILIASLAAIGTSTQAYAKVQPDDALKVANNWISLIINKKGSWGGSEAARAEGVQELKRKGKKIGYFCKVTPRGYIIVSLRKGLAPVQAYSDDSDIDPESDKGMADLIKLKMEGILLTIEKKHGPIDKVKREDLQDMLEINYQSAWDELIGPQGDMMPADFQSGMDTINYQEGDILLSSSWHQSAPYNDQTPAGATCAHTLVGCVATAGAQLMRYWNWPPYGVGTPYSDTYDWRNMLDEVTVTSPAASINAVAELSAEVGQAVGMDYGCGESGAWTFDMEGVYQSQYRYSSVAARYNRNAYTAVNWFNFLKGQFNANRPVQYRVQGHSIVGDGWQEIGAGPTRQYHMNYGWDDGNNTWWTLDGLLLGGVDEEYVIANVYPAVGLAANIVGTFTRDASFPYRYFTRDTITQLDATFESGQNIQFLPDIVVRNATLTGGFMRFEGSSTLNTRLFTRGDTSAGVKISNGTIKMHQNGSIKFY